MKLLALEFSTHHRSAAFVEGDPGGFRVIAEAAEQAARGGSPFPLLERVLESRRDEVEFIAVGLGPGSYTGIRSALAIAQGWHLGRAVLAAGASSAAAIAWEAWEAGRRGAITVVIDAQRKDVYRQTFVLESDQVRETSALEIVPSGELQHEAVTVGPDALRWIPAGVELFPSARAVARMTLDAHTWVPPENLSPIYLRETTFVKAPPPRFIP